MSDRARVLRAGLVRLLLLAATWWAISEGDRRAQGFAVVAVVAATAASLRIAPPGARARPRLVALLRLVRFFVVQSVLGGADVARRALHPRLPIDPGVVEVALRHRDPRVRAAVATLVSMLPGTVAATVGEESMLVHSLDVGLDVSGRVAEAEARVAAALGAGSAP